MVELFSSVVGFLADVFMFIIQAGVIVACIIIVIRFLRSKNPEHISTGEKGRLKVVHLNKEHESMVDTLKSTVDGNPLTKIKQLHKKLDHSKKQSRAPTDEPPSTKRVFVLSFTGDMKASAVKRFREEVTAILSIAKPQDEVLVKLESVGGMVHAYGIASSQLVRIRDAGIPLTVSVDKVAASGGYMMACVADKIVAAPFAILGSIGVIAQLPNFNRFLKGHGIDYNVFKAGEFKQSVNMFAEIDDATRKKMESDIQLTHALFKEHVDKYRPALDVEDVSTGETWYGTRALKKKLIDDIGTSDDLIVSACQEADVFEVSYQKNRSLPDTLSQVFAKAMDNTILTWLDRAHKIRFFS